MLNKVLIVDDSVLIHQMYRMILSCYPCEIVDAMNGREALDLLAVQKDIQLILLDINMPIMNGVQFLEEASPLGITRKVPIIVISTEGKGKNTMRGLELGAKGYLKKPFKQEELYEMIENLLPNSHCKSERTYYQC